MAAFAICCAFHAAMGRHLPAIMKITIGNSFWSLLIARASFSNRRQQMVFRPGKCQDNLI